ncbi:MAG: hypothetical protein WCE49_15055 [Terrimicrobiaceae bacterium]
MNNSVWVVVKLENLIRAFASLPPDAGSLVENFLPSGIVLDLVNNQNVFHIIRPWREREKAARDADKKI